MTDQLRFTILQENNNAQITNFAMIVQQIKSSQKLAFGERGKPEYLGKNLSEQSREPTNSIRLWRWVRKLNQGHIGG